MNWDDFFMGVAKLAAKRSKDPSTQVGACIVDSDNHIVGTGYNGFPKRIHDNDNKLPWDKSSSNWLETKYPYVVHAELNAILNQIIRIKNCKMYVTLYPCNECTKAIIQTGIIEVIYLDDKNINSLSCQASKKLLELADVKIRKYN